MQETTGENKEKHGKHVFKFDRNSLIGVRIYHVFINPLLASSRRMTRKHANYIRATDRGTSIHTFRFLCVFAGRHVNTSCIAYHHGDWRVYTPSFQGVPGVTVGWPRTKGTASNKQVHSFCGFLPNPFIQDLFFWRTSQEFVKTDLYPLSRGLWSLSGMPSVRLGAGR